MYPGRQTWFFLLAFVLCAGLLAGCGGENQSQNGESGGGNKQGSAAHTKVLRGEIKAVKPDTGKIILKPASGEQTESTTGQGGGATSFKHAESAKITVLGKEAQLADLKAGQQAQIEYSIQDGTNKVKSASGEQTEGTTGQGGGATSFKAVSVKVTKQPPVVKTAAGEIKKVKLDTRKIWVRPSSEQNKKIISFRVVQNATITLNGQNAELADLQVGQRAEIRYFAEKGINRAQSVKIGGTAAATGPTAR
jgi:Cu/Ag efflux protein CusF